MFKQKNPTFAVPGHLAPSYSLTQCLLGKNHILYWSWKRIFEDYFMKTFTVIHLFCLSLKVNVSTLTNYTGNLVPNFCLLS